jgi:hypothetical protein
VPVLLSVFSAQRIGFDKRRLGTSLMMHQDETDASKMNSD